MWSGDKYFHSWHEQGIVGTIMVFVRCSASVRRQMVVGSSPTASWKCGQLSDRRWRGLPTTSNVPAGDQEQINQGPWGSCRTYLLSDEHLHHGNQFVLQEEQHESFSFHWRFLGQKIKSTIFLSRLQLTNYINGWHYTWETRK